MAQGCSKNFTAHLASILARDNHLLFSLMKSGTTMVCHAIGFYKALSLGRLDDDFGHMAELGIIRVPSVEDGLRDVQINAAARISQDRIIQTHREQISDSDLEECRSISLLRRNLFDYCVSSYNFHYLNRVSKTEISLEQALPEMVERYMRVTLAQDRILSEWPNAKLYHYEDLMADPELVLREILKDMFGSVREDWLIQALQKSAEDRLTEHETKICKPLIAGEDFSKRHFIRSGRVDEYKTTFSPAQQDLIEQLRKRIHRKLHWESWN